MSIHYHAKHILRLSLLFLLLGQLADAEPARNKQFTKETITGEKLLDYEYEVLGNRKLNMCALEDSKNDYYYKDYIDASNNLFGLTPIQILNYVATSVGVTTQVNSVSELIDEAIKEKLPKTDGICKNLIYDAATDKNYQGHNSDILTFIRLIERIYKLIDLFNGMVNGVPLDNFLDTDKKLNDDDYTYYYDKALVDFNITDKTNGSKKRDFSVPIDFPGDNRTKSSFDLGGFASCEINQTKIETMLISKFCIDSNDTNISISPALTAVANTVNAAGLPSYGGKQTEGSSGSGNTIKKVDERIYPSELNGTQLFRSSDPNKKNDGGYLLGKAKENPNGSTARAFKTFDKASIVLKELAIMTNSKGGDHRDDINFTLPATKADAMDMEDEIVGMDTRLHANFFEFGNILSDKLAKEILTETDMRGQNWTSGAPHVISPAGYAAREKEVVKNYYQSDKSGLAAVYKGIEDAAKARMASEMLIMTADPNYIADPSEARLALIKPSQRTAFRYAALIQQEKNKMLKLKYALEIKRKQQMVDIIKRQSYIRASLFRPETVQHELRHLLQKADASIKIP